MEGWNFALEGEPDFVSEDSVAIAIDKPVGRQIRFNNPVALRTHIPPIGVYVVFIKGKVDDTIEEFFAGGLIIEQQVDLGPSTYFASNREANTNPPQSDPPPEEQYDTGFEPMTLFEFHINNASPGNHMIQKIVR